MVSLGLEVNEKPIFAGATEVAGKLLDAVGLSVHEAKSVTCERLLAITPREIVLEADGTHF